MSVVVGDGSRGADSPGTTAVGGGLHVDGERHFWPSARFHLPGAGAVEHRPGDVHAAALRQAGAVERGRCACDHCPPFLRNRTATDGPLAYWMPLPVLWERANTSRCGCGDAAISLLSTSGKNVLGSGCFRPTRRRRASSRPRVRRRPRARHRGTPGVSTRREKGCGGHPPILPARERNWASGAVLVQRQPGRARGRPGRNAAVGAARTTRCRVAEGRVRAAGPVRMLHRVGRRRTRVACVTPAGRVAGRSVLTVEGLDAAVRDDLAARFVATGASQCGFCTPWNILRLAAAEGSARPGGSTRRALAAHLCRCTGWQSVDEAVEGGVTPTPAAEPRRRPVGRSSKAVCRSSWPVPLGRRGVRQRRRARRRPRRGPTPSGIDCDRSGGRGQVVGVAEIAPRGARLRARCRADAQRRSGTALGRLHRLPTACGSARRGSNRVPEPDASWANGRRPGSPLANGGASAGRSHRRWARGAELADRTGRRRARRVRARGRRAPGTQATADRSHGAFRRRNRARARRSRR